MTGSAAGVPRTRRMFDRLADRLRFNVWARARVNRYPSYNLSHSQFGEDMVVRALFPGSREGVYVDVGAHHPVLYSNTYHFYCSGWRGVTIDALADDRGLFKTLRPRDTHLHACIGRRSGEAVTFYRFDQGAYNTSDPAVAEGVMRRPDVRLVGEDRFTTRTLADVLDAHLSAPRIDLLSVDVEGSDEAVLASNDWERFRPRVVVFERHGLRLEDAGADAIVRLLGGHGYSVYGKCGPSFVMAADPQPD